MKNSIVLVVVALVVASLAACGGGGGVSSPSIPTPPPIPQVAGNYSGTMTVLYPELGESFTCPISTSVTQSGSTINMSPAVMGGRCGGMTLPIGQSVIDATGAIDGGSFSGSVFNSDCGGSYNYTASAGFFGRDLRFSANYTSSRCWNFNLNAVLSR